MIAARTLAMPAAIVAVSGCTGHHPARRISPRTVPAARPAADGVLLAFPVPGYNQPIIYGILLNPRPHVVDVGLGHVGFAWSGDRTAALIEPATGDFMQIRRYDPARHRFGPPLDPCAALADPGVRYKLPIPIGDYAWSPDQSRLAYCDHDRALVVVNLRTGKKMVILRYGDQSEEQNFNTLAWSPDGRRIAYSILGPDVEDASWDTYYDDLWLINADGTGRRKLGHGTQPCWSPDGRYIMCLVGNGNPIVRYDARTGRESTICESRDDIYTSAVYSPDGKYIAVEGPYGHSALYSPRTKYFAFEGPHGHEVLQEGLFLVTPSGRFVRSLESVVEPYRIWRSWLAW